MTQEQLAMDFMRLEQALASEWGRYAGRAADVLLKVAEHGIACGDEHESAIDYLVDGLPVAERVRIKRAAREGGYERPERR